MQLMSVGRLVMLRSAAAGGCWPGHATGGRSAGAQAGLNERSNAIPSSRWNRRSIDSVGVSEIIRTSARYRAFAICPRNAPRTRRAFGDASAWASEASAATSTSILNASGGLVLFVGWLLRALGGRVETVPGVFDDLAGELTRLSEHCRRLDGLPEHRAFLLRAQSLTRDIGNALAEGSRPVAVDSLAAGSPPLTVGSLGRFRVIRGRKPLPPCAARKAIAVFRYLLTRSGRAAHRAELAESIWPDAAPKDAAHSLHVAVSTLRRYLDTAPGTGYLLFTAGIYCINSAVEVTDDADLFEQHVLQADRFWRNGDNGLAEPAYLRAVESYTGDYCVADLDFPWAASERERYLQHYLAALYRLGRLRLKQRRYEAAAECLNRVVERDSYREDVHFQLMLCYSRLGRRWQAIQQYLRCRDLLRTDLGLAPAPRLEELHEAILEHREGSPLPLDWD
jgi:DNA-binding SARP family transcriptional activator